MNTLGYLEVHVTDSCNLNCKGCSHLANLMSPQQHIPFDEFQQDLIRMHELVPKIAKLRLLGGEPFLNSDLSDYAITARNIYIDSDIRIVTNGLLCLSASDRLYSTLRENKIGIDVSLYPPTVRIKEKLETLFEKHGLSYHFTSPITKFAKRIDFAGQSDMQDMFWNCDSKWCNFLRKGILCSCPVPVMLDFLAEKYEIPYIDTSIGKINIHDKDINADMLFEFLNAPNPLCKYCAELRFFEWKSNVKPKLEDWVII